MLIGELSQKTGVSKDTIRFYEKAGLLNASNRCEDNNYRWYDDEAVERLAFIKQGKALGFTLGEIKKVIDEWEMLLPRDKARMTQNKIAEIDEKIKQLQVYKNFLVEKVNRLEGES
jgi:MerR family Zn(II)-responsive transcriptional regulator of zntA